MAVKTRGRKRIALVLTTVAEPAQALRLAHVLLEERLCGCVSIVPAVQSVYRWKGRIEDQGELLLLIKTTRLRLKGLTARLQQLHPYEVPEVMALEPSRVGPAYARWLSDSVEPG